MTQAIDATGNVVTTNSNLVDTNEECTVTRDLTAEKIAKGHFNKGSTYISDEDANNNLDIVTRDGSRFHVNGDYKADDLVMIKGMEVPYDMAVSMGLIKGDNFVSPEEAFRADAENINEPVVPQDTRPEAFQLVEGQVEISLGDKAGDAMELFTSDMILNGELSDAGLEFAKNNLGMKPESVQETIAELVEVGGQTLLSHLEVGDDLGSERINFLVDLSENGSTKERQTIRKLWTEAATGKLTRDMAMEIFDGIAVNYE